MSSSRTQPLTEHPDSGAALTLVARSEVVAELRLALSAELNAVAAEMHAILTEVERSLSPSFDGFIPTHHRLRQVADSMRARHALHEQVGFPGQPLRAEILDGPAAQIAAESLSNRRDHHVSCLAAREVPQDERPAVIEKVQLLTSFLRDANLLAGTGAA